MIHRFSHPFRPLNNHQKQTVFSYRSLVDFATCFKTLISGLCDMLSARAGGLCAMFWKRLTCKKSQHQANLFDFHGNAKVMFTNHIETKDGQSPYCLKESFTRFIPSELFRRKPGFIHHKKRPEVGGSEKFSINLKSNPDFVLMLVIDSLST